MDRNFLMQLGETVHDSSKWVIVQRGSPLFEPFERAPSGLRKHLVLLVSSAEDRELSHQVQAELVEPATRLSLYCLQAEIATVTGTDEVSRHLAYAVAMVMVAGPSWLTNAALAPLAAAQMSAARSGGVSRICVLATRRHTSELDRVHVDRMVPRVYMDRRRWYSQLAKVLERQATDVERQWQRELDLAEQQRPNG
jgi:hypothetical protein